jgi:branched-chain amino acid transport system substrate-binding protein
MTSNWNRIKGRRLALTALTSLMTLTGWAANAQAQVQVPAQDITIGIILATTGAGSAVGVPTRNALALWPTEIGGHKLKLIIQDDRSDPAAATSIARRMASEDKVDVIVGGSLTPSALAISSVANEAGVPQLALSPTVLTEKNAAWTFDLPPATRLMASAVFEHMTKTGVKSVGFIGYSDVWGDQWLGELKAHAATSGVKITAEERYGRADTSVTGQVLRIIAGKPDAVLVGGTSSGAGLVQKALVENGYQGTIYHTHGAVTRDFLRIAGKDAEGAIAPAGPSAVADELPADNPSKAPGMAFLKGYEEKYGAGTRTPFAAHAYDASLVLAKALPVALQKAQPGTQAFRLALKQALEGIKELPASQGVISYTPTDHYGMDQRARVLAIVQGGAWRYLRPTP